MLELIKLNFPSIISTLRDKPLVIIVLALLLSNGYFIRKWVNSKEDCEELVYQVIKEKDEIQAVSWERLIELYDLRTIENRKTEAYDSLLNEKIIKPIEQKE